MNKKRRVSHLSKMKDNLNGGGPEERVTDEKMSWSRKTEEKDSLCHHDILFLNLGQEVWKFCELYHLNAVRSGVGLQPLENCVNYER